ncbi:hypothetical protein K435DRAFT_847217 [Dendrothele bispora CBS 962.96]|uniref:Uncharacterized protein n=1 Tax=Dendrothele bispora (strain CBS 962.96) TaxID=1314807 RepID=A0A4S8MYH7_DENBC|nr:hypothetical protein K435DRAFT_847217 [Dendrothele bispora CBS 962.96]
MSMPEDAFLFACLESNTSTARKTHIRRLYDILQLSIHRNDLSRARRAWAVLARCKEIPWVFMWPIAVHLVGDSQSEEDDEERRIVLLREMIHQFPDQDDPVLHTYAGMLQLYQSQSLQDMNQDVSAVAFDSTLLRNAKAHFERAHILDSDNSVVDAFLTKVTSRLSEATGNLSQENHDSDEEENNDMDTAS